MNSKNTSLLFAIAVLLFFSCQKKDDDNNTNNNSQLSPKATMLVGSWTETHFALDTNKNNQIDSLEKRPRQDYARVNYFFRADGTGGIRLQVYSYPDFDTLPFSWKLQSNNKYLELWMVDGVNLPDIITIEDIDSKSMLIETSSSPDMKLWAYYEKD